jgi:hypothetical protein
VTGWTTTRTGFPLNLSSNGRRDRLYDDNNRISRSVNQAGRR